MVVRAIVWIFGAFILTLIPLGIVAMIEWKPETGSAGLLRILSNEELLAVAFTLGGAAAIDVLVNSAGFGRSFKILAGCSALTMTIITVVSYILLRANLIHDLDEDSRIGTTQALYLGTVLNSFICEILSEAR
jgi:hypothetical protein